MIGRLFPLDANHSAIPNGVLAGLTKLKSDRLLSPYRKIAKAGYQRLSKIARTKTINHNKHWLAVKAIFISGRQPAFF